MPLYAFELRNQDTGEIVAHFDLPLPVGQRDALEVRRLSVPDRLNVVGLAPDPYQNSTLRCLHRAEERMGNTAEFYHKIQFSPETYKRVWATP